MTARKHRVITDFGGAEVRRNSDGLVPRFLRPWESVPATDAFTQPKWEKLVRRTSATGYPAFDMFSEWLMDFATISAGQLGLSDWQNFRRMLLLHVPDCDLYCWYCFNDAWDGLDGITAGELEAAQIVDEFDKYATGHAKHGEEVNVLRISGGEPFMNPSLITDIAKEFAKLRGRRFLWVDTNLHPFGAEIGSEHKAALDALSELSPRVAVHACIHGATAETLQRNSMNTTTPSNIAGALKAFAARRIPTYPRINPAALRPIEVRQVFGMLRDISQDDAFPLKTYLGPIQLHYEHTNARMRLFHGDDPSSVTATRRPPEGRTPAIPSLMPANAAIFEWNRLLEDNYGVGYAKIPRHLASGVRPFATPPSRGALEWTSAILLCKGWEREVYARKMLEIMSLPNGSYVEVEFENTWIEPNLLAYASICPAFCKNDDVPVLVTCCYKASRTRGMIPVRWATLRGLSSTDHRSERHSLSFTLEVGDYAAGLQQRVPGNQGEGFFERMARYVGSRHLPFASGTSYFCQYVGFEEDTRRPGRGTEAGHGFKHAVIELVEPKYEAAKRDIYFRVKAITDVVAKDRNPVFKEGILMVAEGQEIEIVFEACNPNMDSTGYPTTDDARIRLSTTEADRVSISPDYLWLSKYGEPTARVTFQKAGEYYGDILIDPAREGVRIPSFRIPFHVEVRK